MPAVSSVVRSLSIERMQALTTADMRSSRRGRSKRTVPMAAF